MTLGKTPFVGNSSKWPSGKTKTDAFVPYGGQEERNTAPNEPSTRTIYYYFICGCICCPFQTTFLLHLCRSHGGFSIAGTLIFLCKASFVRVWSYMCLRIRHLVMTALFTEDESCEEVCRCGKGRISASG
jgi:hypothetical protein